MDGLHRSTDPRDYQNVPQPIVVMSKRFDDGHTIPLHNHARDQLLYAVGGIMRLQTMHHAWLVPPDGAICIPGGTDHTVTMFGDVEMRTLYIDVAAVRARPQPLCVIAVTSLMRELILALSKEPIAYTAGSRAAHIARMIELEIEAARQLALHVPLPADRRLQNMCAALLADPSDGRTLEQWSHQSGASARTLARLFERDLGMGFNAWRQRVRFQSAVEALSRGQPVSLVAHKHGYSSPSAFTAAFRRAMGMPPSALAVQGNRATPALRPDESA
ncbi:AraC family transcriptional regulator [Hoeflea poritis]|uniref:Helix-turn-helix transcriptional regulator n=1 Tax=Hoeflea poritis TaxID=2993659 RepID=A0ABT4VHW1_9HYPH|nr:helix-turn-helix transcriptional regulator [Hoeflea poritis]MDA4844277.1 helix-turn-helix transcriptional regulator [Hoeflea poritis]